MKSLNVIRKAMEALITDPKTKGVERIEAARIILATHGLLLQSGFDNPVPGKMETQLKFARRLLSERLFEQKARKALHNRKQYIKRRIAELQESGENPAMLAEFRRELQAGGTVAGQTPEEKDAERANMAEMGEWAKTYLAELEEKE